MNWPLVRGQVVRVHFGNLDEPKLFVVVSNNVRNRVLGSVLAARLTPTGKPVIPSIVEIPAKRESMAAWCATTSKSSTRRT